MPTQDSWDLVIHTLTIVAISCTQDLRTFYDFFKTEKQTLQTFPILGCISTGMVHHNTSIVQISCFDSNGSAKNLSPCVINPKVGVADFKLEN